MKRAFIIAIVLCLAFISCSKSPEKEAAEIDKAAKILAKTVEIQTNQAKLRTTEKEIMLIATALADYITDSGIVPPSDPNRVTFPFAENSETYKALVPTYASSLPTIDPWGRPYELMLGEECGFFFAIKDTAKDDFLIVSRGVNGNHEKWEYDPSNNSAGLFTEFNDSYNIINFNGLMIRDLKK